MAATVVVPIVAAVASPDEPEALLMVATAGFDELHTAAAVRFWVVPSVKVPVAVNCVVKPWGALGLTGVTPIDTRVAGVIVTLWVPDTLPSVALSTAVPGVTAVTSPVALTEPTCGESDVHTTEFVMSCVVPSEYTPVAVSCPLTPLAMLEPTPLISMDTSVAAVTATGVDPDTPLRLAVIEPVPRPFAVTRPWVPAVLLTKATVDAAELQVTELVRFCVVLFEYTPVATNDLLRPTGMLGLVGVTSIDTKVAAVTVRVVETEMPSYVAVIVVVPGSCVAARPAVADTLLMAAALELVETQVMSEAGRSFLVPLL